MPKRTKKQEGLRGRKSRDRRGSKPPRCAPANPEYWYPDPFVPEQRAALDQISATQQRQSVPKSAKRRNDMSTPPMSSGHRHWQRGEGFAAICNDAHYWEHWLRLDLHKGLDLNVDVCNWGVDQLRQLQTTHRSQLSTEQSGVIDMIVHLSAIRTAISSFVKSLDRLTSNDAEIVKDEGAALAAQLVSNAVSLVGMAAEISFDRMVGKHEASVAKNRDNARHTRKLTPELKEEALSLMDEYCRSDDAATTKVAKRVADEMNRRHGLQISHRTYYDAYVERSAEKRAFPLLQTAGSEETAQVSSCRQFSSSPLESAMYAAAGRGPRP